MSTPDTSVWTRPPVIESPFDQYQRYRLVAEMAVALQGTLGRAPRVLDVGGHHWDFYGHPRRPIAEALPWCATVTVDLADNTLPGYVKAIGDHLPFGAKTFDAVASVDVLEHVPARFRSSVLDEVLRVASTAAVIAAPFEDWRVVRAEEIFSGFIHEILGAPQQQLAEHRANGLPRLDETVAHIERAGWTARVVPYGNLWRWVFMMIDKFALGVLPGARPVHQQMDADYNQELFERDRETPCYRHFVVATRTADHPLLDFATTRFGARPLCATAAPPPTDDTADTILRLAEEHARRQALAVKGEPLRRDTQVVEVSTHAENLVRGLAAKDAYIAKLEQLLRDVEGSLTFRVSRQVRRIMPGS